MASTFSGRVSLSVKAIEFINTGVANGQLPAEIIEDFALPRGVAIDQIDLAFFEQKSGINASVTTVYDLTGSMTDLSGAPINFASVSLIAIRNRSIDDADHLEVGPDASNGFGVLAGNRGFWKDASDRSVIMANSWWVVYNRAGVLVGAGSADELAVITPAGSAGNSWDIIVMGRSA